MNLTFKKKRLIATGAFMLALLPLANFEFEWSLFGEFDGEVAFVSFLFVIFLVFRFGPSPSEVRDYFDAKKRAGMTGIGR